MENILYKLREKKANFSKIYQIECIFKTWFLKRLQSIKTYGLRTKLINVHKINNLLKEKQIFIKWEVWSTNKLVFSSYRRRIWCRLTRT